MQLMHDEKGSSHKTIDHFEQARPAAAGQRVKWSDGEIATLQRGIELFGDSSWADIHRWGHGTTEDAEQPDVLFAPKRSQADPSSRLSLPSLSPPLRTGYLKVHCEQVDLKDKARWLEKQAYKQSVHGTR